MNGGLFDEAWFRETELLESYLNAGLDEIAIGELLANREEMVFTLRQEANAKREEMRRELEKRDRDWDSVRDSYEVSGVEENAR